MDNEKKSIVISSEKQLRVFSEKSELILALTFERVGTEVSEGKMKIIGDTVAEKFPDLHEKYIIQALKHGSMGDYGKTYNLTAQEVCIWIREYMEANPEPPEAVWNRFNGKISVAMEENKNYNWHQAKLHCMREKIIDDRIHSLEAQFRFKEEK